MPTLPLRPVTVTLAALLLAVAAYALPTGAKADDNANFQAGIAAYQANNLPLAYKEFLAAAEAGHADSQFNVALMYEQGLGVGKDETEALVWYGKAAAHGHAPAQFNLAVMHENGRGTAVDFTKANAWYRKAAAQGDALAIGNLGMLYVRGQGVPENRIAGVALLILSATLDPSPENHAKQNLAATRGLKSDMIVAAQALSEQMRTAKDPIGPLDAYMAKAETKTEQK